MESLYVSKFAIISVIKSQLNIGHGCASMDKNMDPFIYQLSREMVTHPYTYIPQMVTHLYTYTCLL
jgi:hypothetical protein